jgi:hypothetical protein
MVASGHPHHVEKEELGWWLQITGQHYREKLMKHIQRDRKHIIWVCFAAAMCLLAIIAAFGIGVVVGRTRALPECAPQPPNAQPDTKEKTAPKITDPEFISIRDCLTKEAPWVLSYAERVMNMQRSARKTYHELKSDPAIAPDVVALYADTLTWKSPLKIVGELEWALMKVRSDLYKLDVAYRNLFGTDFFEGITIEERKRHAAMKSPASQPAQKDVGNVPEATHDEKTGK